jgi:glycosyltransferase involved in cell wall biosynthesis
LFSRFFSSRLTTRTFLGRYRLRQWTVLIPNSYPPGEACPSLSSESNAVNKSSALTTNRFPCGSDPEIIVEGETGFIVKDIDRAVEAVGKIEQISRARCRREFEQRFTERHMAEDYIRIYEQLLSRSSTQAAA